MPNADYYLKLMLGDNALMVCVLKAENDALKEELAKLQAAVPPAPPEGSQP